MASTSATQIVVAISSAIIPSYFHMMKKVTFILCLNLKLNLDHKKHQLLTFM
jgi:hypothetical protein